MVKTIEPAVKLHFLGINHLKMHVLPDFSPRRRARNCKGTFENSRFLEVPYISYYFPIFSTNFGRRLPITAAGGHVVHESPESAH
jgi:hypothetical protein